MEHILIFDLGGVLMQHDMAGCIAAFTRLMGAEAMQQVLGLCPNGEGVDGSLMDRFECGMVDEQEFVDTLLSVSRPGTTAEDIVAAWNTMHAGIPLERLERIREWQQEGNHILLLSNNNALHYRDVMDHYDMSMFDYCFASHLVHVRKPDAGIFAHVQQFINSQPWSGLPICFVDDLAANRVAAEAFGWRTFPDIDSLVNYHL